MARARCSEEEFIRLFHELGASGAAKYLNVERRKVLERRRNIEKKRGIEILNPAARDVIKSSTLHNPQWINDKVTDGYILIGSDCHYWPHYISTAHRAFVKFAKKLQPKVIVLNGDVVDGASASRHPPIGWENAPSLDQEISVATERTDEIQRAAPNAKRRWTLGNHDARFETRLATVAPEYRGVKGVHLKDHFPYWDPCWSILVNDDLVIKHRFKGGIHATHNNTLWSGKSICTGHLHSLKATPFTDYNGTRWGVDGGTLADPYGPQFRDYTEENPLNWRSGFVVLRFVGGRMLQPQLVLVVDDGLVDYCGELVEV